MFLLAACLAPEGVHAQAWGTALGRIVAADTGDPIPSATVVVTGTNYGTASDETGRWTLRLPDGRYRLRFSAIGFSPRLDSVVVLFGRETRIDAALPPATAELGEVTIEDTRGIVEAGVFEITPRAARDIPTPVRDVARLLKVLPGVATNNELSNQVSVRGGGFNENLFFLNGFEIFLPFRPRQGEQEGLSLLNADLADRITFYAGGFPAWYGGKLSSAVEVQYRRPELEPGLPSGTAHVSVLDAGLSLGGSAARRRIGWLLGVRRAQPRSLFGTQELKGDYDPSYTDLQGVLRWDGPRGIAVEAIGVWAAHRYTLSPDARRTFFGTVSQDPDLAPSNLQSMWIRYDDGNEERDGYDTGFGGLRIMQPLGRGITARHDVAVFSTVETERYDLSGTAVLYLVDPGSTNPTPGSGLFPSGTSRQEDAADNRVSVRTITGRGRYTLPAGSHLLDAGWEIRDESFDDRIDEKSVVSGRSTEGLPVRIVADSLQDAASLQALRGAVFVQDVFPVIAGDPDRFTATVSLRADHFDFNREWTLSPRVGLRYRLREGTVLLGSWGIYHQSPTYRELRGRPEPGETSLGALNDNLVSQRSNQVVGGVEYFLSRLRFLLRAEAYYRSLSNVISYDIDNVRVRYSGDNDSKGHAAGLDLQLRGEFVPGLESWVNYSFLSAREEFLPAFRTAGRPFRTARPTDQRHTFSLYLQDYVRTDPTWKLHLRMLYGSGLPYTPPVPGPKVGSLIAQIPGDRFSARYPRYFRFDMGVTKQVTASTTGLGRPVSLFLTFEILNVFDMINTVAYSWIPNQSGIWTRVPTRLTPRTFNVRARVDF